MIISTWNTERLKHFSKLGEMQKLIASIDADILVLTEYDLRLELKQYPYSHFSTEISQPQFHEKPTERKTAVFSKYPILKTFPTFNDEICCCAELQTEKGKLIVYATVIGVTGNRRKNFLPDLKSQTEDWKERSKLGTICIAGDFNLSFSDNYYFTKEGRNIAESAFSAIQLQNLMKNVPENIDHIVISESFMSEIENFEIMVFNQEKALSDHKGISIKL